MFYTSHFLRDFEYTTNSFLRGSICRRLCCYNFSCRAVGCFHRIKCFCFSVIVYYKMRRITALKTICTAVIQSITWMCYNTCILSWLLRRYISLLRLLSHIQFAVTSGICVGVAVGNGIGVGIGVDVAFGAKGLLPDITLNIIKPADMNTINVATIIATINAVLLLFFFECLLPFVFLEKSFLIPFNCFCDCILFCN